jgi:hypothetical protein
MKFDDRKALRALNTFSSCRMITKKVEEDVEAFFLRNPGVERTRFAEYFAAALAVARLGKPSL